MKNLMVIGLLMLFGCQNPTDPAVAFKTLTKDIFTDVPDAGAPMMDKDCGGMTVPVVAPEPVTQVTIGPETDAEPPNAKKVSRILEYKGCSYRVRYNVPSQHVDIIHISPSIPGKVPLGCPPLLELIR